MTQMKRIYAILEIQNHQLLFSVFKISHQNHILIYKTAIEHEKKWLDENGCLLDLNLASLHLSKTLRDFTNLYPHIILTKIALVIPTTWLSVRYLSHDFYPTTPINNQLLNQLKMEAEKSPTSRQVIETKTLNWLLDNQPLNLDQKTIPVGTKLTYKALSYEVATNVLDSYYQLLKSMGLDCLWITSNLQALFRLVNNQNQQSFLIANWTFDTIEIGYFESGLLKRHLTYHSGLETLKQKLMNNLMLPKSEVNRYLFDLIDYGTVGNWHHTILQKWDYQQKILKKYSLKQFKKELQNILQRFYFLAQKELFSHTDKPVQLWNYHFGLINSISGIDNIMNYGRRKNHFFSQESVVGAWNAQRYQVACGVIKTLERLNNYLPNPTIYTSIGNFVKTNEATNVTVNFDKFGGLINETLAIKPW